MNNEEFSRKLNEIKERALAKSTPEEETQYTESLFESIKHIDENGDEFWYARELSKVLEYRDFRNFELTIYKAMDACENSSNIVSDHFGEVTEMVPIGSGAKRGFKSYKLSRYACYLIVMNGDPSKKIIALGQTYFAVKTRQQELIENFDDLTEDKKRLAIPDSHLRKMDQLLQIIITVLTVRYDSFQFSVRKQIKTHFLDIFFSKLWQNVGNIIRKYAVR